MQKDCVRGLSSPQTSTRHTVECHTMQIMLYNSHVIFSKSMMDNQFLNNLCARIVLTALNSSPIQYRYESSHLNDLL